VPALGFAGAGFLAGHAARVGLEEFTVGAQEYTVWADGSTDLPRYEANTDVLAGRIELWIDGVVAGDVPAPDLRVAIGSVEIWADDTLAVDVVGRVRSGTVRGPAGRELESDGEWHTYRLGPDGPADLVVRVDMSLGELRLHTISGLDMSLPRPPQLVTVPLVPVEPPRVTAPAANVGVDIGGGLTMTADGTVIFPNPAGDPSEQVWLTPDGQLGGPFGDMAGPNGVTTVYVTDGSEYLVLPNQAIVTPDGAVIDVAAVRSEWAAQENSPEPETNRPVATSESVDDDAPSVTTVAVPNATTPTTAPTTTRNEQD
jgi:hypothetical protein